MATLRMSFVLVSLLFLIVVGAETSVEEYKRLKDDVFGRGYESFCDTVIEQKIHRMIKLIESGDIPVGVYGEQTLERLKSMTDDCGKTKCNLEEDVQKLERLRARLTGSPNLKGYLRLCQVRIKIRCELEIYNRANEKLSSVDEESMKAVDALAKQLDHDVGPRDFGEYDPRPDTDYLNHAVVLRALKRLDPEGSKAMLKKWTNRKASLSTFMDKIRLPCTKFLEHVDPLVKLITANYHYSYVGKWHFYLDCCEKVVNEWDTIFKNAYSSYTSHLADPKPEKTSCFSGCFDGSYGDSDGGGGGVSTNTLIWMGGAGR